MNVFSNWFYFALWIFFLIPVFNIVLNFSIFQKRLFITTLQDTHRALLGVILFAVFVRLLATLWQLHNFDHDSCFMIGEALSQRRDVYADPELVPRYPYLPLQMYLSLAAYYINQNITGSFLFLCKLPAIFGDIAIIVLLHKITLYLNQNYNRAFFTSLAYAVCPISITVSAYHGQFDSITLAFLLLSLYFFYQKRPLWVGLWFSISITTKIWPIIFIPLFVLLLHTNRERLKFLLLVPFVPIISIVFYCLLVNGSPFLVIKTSLEYGGGVLGYWGIGAVVDIVLRPVIYDSYSIVASLSLFLRFVMLLALLTYYRYRMNVNSPERNFVNIMLLFFIFAPGFGGQWLLWLLPFLLLSLIGRNEVNSKRQVKAYNAHTIFAFMIGIYTPAFSYLLVILNKEIVDHWLAGKIAHQLTTLPLWLCLIVWITNYQPKTRLLSIITGVKQVRSKNEVTNGNLSAANNHDNSNLPTPQITAAGDSKRT
jgi:hypothetical protein